MYPRWNWDAPNPSIASECAPSPRTKGEGEGESQFRPLEKSLALCLFCVKGDARNFYFLAVVL